MGTDRKIGRYIVEAELGRGAFGVVYRAFDPTINRPVAVKLLQASEPNLLSRFRNEAMVGGNLRHRNIVTVYEFGEHDGRPYLVTELLEGRTLRDLIVSRQPLPLLDKMSLMSQVAEALAHAHGQGVIHKDIKPANIFVLPDGTAKLLDFGIAQLHDDAARTGQIAGTLSYMAPEQLQGGTIDLRADIWSYGVVYYELLTGINPFDADTPANIAGRILHVEPAPVGSLAPECPQALEVVIHRTLAKDLETRYASLNEVQFDLEPVVLDLRRQKAGELMVDAQRLVTEKNFDSAMNVVRQILELDPGDRDARKLREAVQQQLRRRSLAPRIDSLLKGADENLAKRNYAEAIQAFESTLRLDPADRDVQRRLEQARTLLEQHRKAAHLLEEGQRELASGNLDAAIAAVNAAMEADPENQRAAEFLGLVQAAVDRREAERRLGGQLAEIRQLIQDGKIDEVEQRLSLLESESPVNPDVRPLLEHARHEIAARRRREAVDAVTKRVSGTLEQQDYDAALNLLDAGLAHHPGEPELLRLRESAARAQATEARSNAIQASVHEIDDLRKQGKLEEALQRLSTALAGFPEEPELARTRASLVEELREQKLIAQTTQALEQRDGESALKLLNTLRAESAGRPEVAALKERARTAAAEQNRRQLLDRQLARELEQAKDPAGALQVVELAMAAFPAEPGLKELSASLQEQIASVDVRQASVRPAEPGATAVAGEFTQIFPPARALPDEEFSLLILESPNPTAINKCIRITSFPFATGSLDSDLAPDHRLAPEHITIERAGGRFSIRARAPGVYLDGRAIPVGEPRPLLFDSKIRLTEATHAIFEPQARVELPDLSGLLIAGRYRVVKRLHASTTAAVYSAEDEKLSKSVALKVLTPQLAAFESYVEQFHNEARVASKLRHPNICRVLDFGATTVALAAGHLLRVVYLCMELMEGGSLRKQLEASRSIAAGTIVGWVKTVAETLDHAHRNKIVHSGLKPSSIVFDTDGHPYLTDFAIATHPGDASVRAIIGAPAFLAPEQWLGEAAVPATDQYALAVLAYYLITGTKPFEGQADPDARRKNFSREPVPAHVEAAVAGRTGVPPGVSSVLARALSVNPNNRYPSTSDFAADLAKAFTEPAPAVAAKVKPKVFFSYRRDLSGGWATLFSIEMQRKGISVFIDVGKQDSAVQFPERLKKEIQSCDVFLCFVAEGTFQSAWVDTEVRVACESGKPMLPILQESFRRDDFANPGEHIRALLNYNGVRLIDQYVKAGITEAVRVIKHTAKGRTT